MEDISTESSVHGVPQTPDLSPSTLEQRRLSVPDADKASEVCRRLRDDNKDRVAYAARIRRKVDGIDPPLDAGMLAEEGKEHKSNFSTGFLGTIVSRAVPRFVMRVKQSQYLTASKLAVSVPDSTEKTQKFRQVVTDTIRNWKGWNFFLYQLANLNVLDGKTFVGYDGPGEWKPRAIRIDEGAVPNGIKQGEVPPFFYVSRQYSVARLFSFIEPRELAEEAGWNIDNVVEAINSARPRRSDDDKTPDESALTYEDMLRQAIPHYGFDVGYNSIDVDILYSEESDGTVSQWVVNRDNGEELFFAESLYRSMQDVVQYICYDIGDGSVYGSYGIGELLYDLAVHLEKSRNSALDNLLNRGKIFQQISDPAAQAEAVMQVTDDSVYIIGAEPVGSKVAMPSVGDEFILVDRYLKQIGEEKAGVFLPDNQQTDKTATQAQIDALKEAETTDSKMDFWLTYLSHVISMIQRRMMDPDTQDADAIRAREECLAYMSEEELQALAMQPPAQTSIDWSERKQQSVAQFLTTKVNNPRWDQYFIEKTMSELLVGTDITERGMIPEGDETSVIEARRQQMAEVVNMLAQGYAVPVSPRDNHLESMAVLSGERDPSGNWTGMIFDMLREGNSTGAQFALAHYIEHAQHAAQQDILGEAQNQVKQFVADTHRGIERASQVDQQFSEQEAQVMGGDEQAQMGMV